jgi:hypothetical protein
VIQITANGKSVAIVAMGRSQADYTKEAAIHNGRCKEADEIWAVNAMGDVLKHDRLFVMDDLRVFVKRMEKAGRTHYTDWMKVHDKPIYTSIDYPEFPSSVRYPLERVIKTLQNPSYFNSTVAYALALAIVEGFETIKLYGCDFTYENNHRSESGRGCVEFLIGIGHAMGISMQVAGNSTLMDQSVPSDHKLYGYIRQPKVSTSEQGYEVSTPGGVNYEDIRKVGFEHGRYVLVT